MVLVYTTCRDSDEARKLAELAISKKLAASVDMWPIHSMRISGGEIKDVEGYALIMRTLESRMQEIEDLMPGHFSTGFPFVSVLDVKRINRAYKEWMAQVVE